MSKGSARQSSGHKSRGAKNGNPTKQQLLRLQHEWISRQIKELDRRDEVNFDRVRERLLGIPASETTVIGDALPPGEPMRVRLALRRLVLDAERHGVELVGANPDGAPQLSPTRFGKTTIDLPTWGMYFFPAGTLARAPLIVRLYKPNQHSTPRLEVHGPTTAADQATTYRRQLWEDAYTIDNPFRNTTLVAKWYQGLDFDVVDDFTEKRERVVLPESIWRTVDENVHGLFTHLDAIQRAGLASNRGVMLVGAPGTGKTAVCRVIASELAGKVTVILCSAPVAQKFLRQLYSEVAHLTPAVVLLEDLDLIVGDREEGRTNVAALAEFLNVLDGLMTEHQGVATVATTNDPRTIDKAAKRSARFDKVIAVPLPSAQARKAILGVYTKRLKFSGGLTEVVAATDGCTGADLRDLVTQAVLQFGESVKGVQLVELAREQAKTRSGRRQIGYRSSAAQAD